MIIPLILISILLLPVVYIDCMALYSFMSYIIKQVKRLINGCINLHPHKINIHKL